MSTAKFNVFSVRMFLDRFPRSIYSIITIPGQKWGEDMDGAGVELGMGLWGRRGWRTAVTSKH